ncbi:NAD(P)H-dependent oxidoreductase [Microbulbifer sp. OS29]|uniref:FMN dependent NADH:quinone oxidoreductase n=1 Tax=Microbulbifer okhotskensis TaxID=2926617 RepID=A0A9X2J6U2_9GAMM|nr:NAD(P)H-dependent oxidoreductase [Microbulbifer okhotskensis]MCO1334995.1 NAD(P)H-dependent oxidoreductase [Microbulbifer okhotskensis]
MAKLLNIQSSMFQASGQSSQLAAKYVQNWAANNPSGEVIQRNLVAKPVPHLDLERFQAFNTPSEQRTPEQQAVVDFSDKLIAEISSADVLVLGVPMYNFTIPSMLHTYFDHIARSGVTFRYTENGPVGLIGNKKVIAFVTRGGIYGDDHAQSAFLRQFLGFIGMTNIEFVYTEGLAIGDKEKETALTAADARIAELA